MAGEWETVLIATGASISDAIAKIDAGSMRFGLVVDADKTLLGAVSDGDIRRAIIKRCSLDAPVDSIMNTNPIVADKTTSRAALLSLMERQDLLFVPIVEKGKVVGLETLFDLLQTKSLDNPVFLSAGGFGTRLQPLTDTCPKPLLKVGDKAILQIILENFVAAGFHRFYISTHFMAEKIREHFGDGSRWGVEISYIHEEQPLGTAGALSLLPDDLPDLPIIMMNGDVLTKVDFGHLLNYHNEHRGIATMCVREYEYQVPFGVVEFSEHRVTGMVEKPIQRYFVNAGIYVVEPQLLQKLQRGQRIDMPDLLNTCLDEKQDLTMFPVHEYWLDIGRMNDFQRAQTDYIKDFQ